MKRSRYTLSLLLGSVAGTVFTAGPLLGQDCVDPSHLGPQFNSCPIARGEFDYGVPPMCGYYEDGFARPSAAQPPLARTAGAFEDSNPLSSNPDAAPVASDEPAEAAATPAADDGAAYDDGYDYDGYDYDSYDYDSYGDDYDNWDAAEDGYNYDEESYGEEGYDSYDEENYDDAYSSDDNSADPVHEADRDEPMFQDYESDYDYDDSEGYDYEGDDYDGYDFEHDGYEAGPAATTTDSDYETYDEAAYQALSPATEPSMTEPSMADEDLMSGHDPVHDEAVYGSEMSSDSALDTPLSDEEIQARDDVWNEYGEDYEGFQDYEQWYAETYGLDNGSSDSPADDDVPPADPISDAAVAETVEPTTVEPTTDDDYGYDDYGYDDDFDYEQWYQQTYGDAQDPAVQQLIDNYDLGTWYQDAYGDLDASADKVTSANETPAGLDEEYDGNEFGEYDEADYERWYAETYGATGEGIDEPSVDTFDEGSDPVPAETAADDYDYERWYQEAYGDSPAATIPAETETATLEEDAPQAETAPYDDYEQWYQETYGEPAADVEQPAASADTSSDSSEYSYDDESYDYDDGYSYDDYDYDYDGYSYDGYDDGYDDASESSEDINDEDAAVRGDVEATEPMQASDVEPTADSSDDDYNYDGYNYDDYDSYDYDYDGYEYRDANEEVPAQTQPSTDAHEYKDFEYGGYRYDAASDEWLETDSTTSSPQQYDDYEYDGYEYDPCTDRWYNSDAPKESLESLEAIDANSLSRVFPLIREAVSSLQESSVVRNARQIARDLQYDFSIVLCETGLEELWHQAEASSCSDYADTCNWQPTAPATRSEIASSDRGVLVIMAVSMNTMGRFLQDASEQLIEIATDQTARLPVEQR